MYLFSLNMNNTNAVYIKKMAEKQKNELNKQKRSNFKEKMYMKEHIEKESFFYRAP